MNTPLTPLSHEDRFPFSCSPELACFNQCCRDLNQFLTPYDILRLKNGLKLRASDFLQKYTTEHTGPESGLPVITLKPATGPDQVCPFVRPDGCHVYANRPSSCRMYPLARVLSRSRETGTVSERYVLIHEPHCHGRQTARTLSVAQWIAEQELSVYNKMNDLMLDIISLKNRRQPGPLDIRQRHLFRMALYDTDRFRSYLSHSENLENQKIGLKKPESAADDTALLEFGFVWIKAVLFGQQGGDTHVFI